MSGLDVQEIGDAYAVVRFPEDSPLAGVRAVVLYDPLALGLHGEKRRRRSIYFDGTPLAVEAIDVRSTQERPETGPWIAGLLAAADALRDAES